jgi:hypothetical protein
VTDRDLYADARAVAARLASRGEHDAARRIADAIDGGSTSSEILFGLRAELDCLLDGALAQGERAAVADL